MRYLIANVETQESCVVGDLNGWPYPWLLVDQTNDPDDPLFGLPLEAARERRREEVNRILASKLADGFTPASGPLAGHTLQTRNAADFEGWQDSRNEYAEAVEEGAGSLAGATIRTAENRTIGVTYAQGLDALNDLFAWRKSLRIHSWLLKDAIAAADAVTLPTIDLTEGW